MPSFSVQVPADFQGSLRLDKYIASLPGGMNRSKLKSCAIEILVNGKEHKLSAAVKALDIIDVQWDDNVPDDITPENIALSVLYEDENVAVVDKAQGMVTHPAAGNWTGTLVNALLYRWGRSSISRIKDTPPSLAASSTHHYGEKQGRRRVARSSVRRTLRAKRIHRDRKGKAARSRRRHQNADHPRSEKQKAF